MRFSFEHQTNLQKLYWKTLQQHLNSHHLQGAKKVRKKI